MTRYRFYLFWKEKAIFTRKGDFNFFNNFCSFITECTDLLEIIFTFCIYFKANTLLLHFYVAFHTLPNPPFPTTNFNWNELMLIIVFFYYFSKSSVLYFKLLFLSVRGSLQVLSFNSLLILMLLRPSKLTCLQIKIKVHKISD